MPLPKPGQPVRGSQTGRPIMALLDLLGRRWMLRIIWELRNGTLRFRELQTRCGDLSPTTLNQRLKDLDGTGIVGLTDDGYALTPDGWDLLAALAPLKRWADRWDNRQGGRQHPGL
jgi:DNA-binding HxlR family transcriptional regulator